MGITVGEDISTNPTVSPLSAVGRGLLEPKIISSNSKLAGWVVPALPSTLLLGLLGFLIVVTFRERRLIMSLMVQVSSLGRSGVEYLPELGRRLGDRWAILSTSVLQRHFSSQVEQDCPEGRFDIVSYVGMLHRLADSEGRAAGGHNIEGAQSVGRNRLDTGSWGLRTSESNWLITLWAVLADRISYFSQSRIPTGKAELSPLLSYLINVDSLERALPGFGLRVIWSCGCVPVIGRSYFMLPTGCNL